MINVIFICSTNLFIDSHCKQCLFIISKSMSLVRESQLGLVHIPFTLTILRVDTLQLHLLLSLVTESFLRPIPFIAVALAHLRFCLITHITPPFAASVIAAHRILPLHSPSQKPTHRHIPSAPPPPPAVAVSVAAVTYWLGRVSLVGSLLRLVNGRVNFRRRLRSVDGVELFCGCLGHFRLPFGGCMGLGYVLSSDQLARSDQLALRMTKLAAGRRQSLPNRAG